MLNDVKSTLVISAARVQRRAFGGKWEKQRRKVFYNRVSIDVCEHWDSFVSVDSQPTNAQNDLSVLHSSSVNEFDDSDRFPMELQLEFMIFNIKSVVDYAVFLTFDWNANQITIHTELQKFSIFFKIFLKWRKDIYYVGKLSKSIGSTSKNLWNLFKPEFHRFCACWYPT